MIEGNTDNVGSEESNFDLSQRRADSVQSYLISRGIRASRLSTSGLGEGSPVADNDSVIGRPTEPARGGHHLERDHGPEVIAHSASTADRVPGMRTRSACWAGFLAAVPGQPRKGTTFRQCHAASGICNTVPRDALLR